MNISIFSSDKFYDQLRVMLLSFFDYNNFEKHNIYIMSVDMKEKNIAKLNKILKNKYDQEVTLFTITEEMRKGFQDSKRFSAAGFYKLYAFRYLPIKVDRILCLDTDMIIRGSLKDYYYQDFENNVIIGCNSVIDINTKKHCDELSLKDFNRYINLGAIVIDVEKYLSEYDVDYYLEWYNAHKKEAIHVVQDILNVLFEDKIKVCDYSKWNMQILFIGYNDDEIKKMRENSRIIHYLGKYKMRDCRYYIRPKMFYYEVLVRHNLWGEYMLVKTGTFIFSTFDRIKRFTKKIINK